MPSIDPQTPFYRRIPVLLVGAGLMLLAGVSLLPRFLGSGKKGKFETGHLLNSGSLSDLVTVYGQAWVRVQAQVDELRHADEENAKLRLQNAHLRLGLESLQFNCHTQSAAKTTRNYERRLTQETGTEAGRLPAGITYHLPPGLSSTSLYTLGMDSLRAHEYEKAAVTLTALSDREEGDGFRSTRNLLIAGVAWYRIENLTRAEGYFDEVLKKPEAPEWAQFQAQARLWKAVIAKKLKKEVKSQFWLSELMDHHPHSAEVNWVNDKPQ